MQTQWNIKDKMALPIMIYSRMICYTLSCSWYYTISYSQTSTQTHINVDHIHSIIQYVFDVMS